MDLLGSPVCIEILVWFLTSVVIGIIYRRCTEAKDRRSHEDSSPYELPSPPVDLPPSRSVSQAQVKHDDGIRRRHVASTDSVPVPATKANSDEAQPGNAKDIKYESDYNKWRRFFSKRVVKLVALIITGYVITVVTAVLLYRWQENFFLYSDAITCENVTQSEGDDLCDYLIDNAMTEDVFLPINSSADSPVVHVWLIRGIGYSSASEQSRFTILMSHGNVENVASYKHIYSWLSGMGLDVVAWDYPGFGKSSGASDERTIHAAAELVLRHLLEGRGVPLENLILWGYSLGGSIVVDLAVKYPSVAGVILQAPLDSAADVLRHALPLTGWAMPLLLTQPYDTKSKIVDLRACLFIFVGSNDTQFSVERERNLFVTASNADPGCRRFFLVEGLSHLGNPLDNDDFAGEVGLFLDLVVTKNL